MTLTYLGPPGSDLGFRLAGMVVAPCNNFEELLEKLQEIAEEERGGIIFVDEELASQKLDEVERLNEAVRLTIVLLANPAKPKHLAAKSLDKLILQAVGSDIFSS